MQLELVDLWLRQHSAISHHHHSAQSKPLPQLLRSQQRCAELRPSSLSLPIISRMAAT
jgi:hypothetical protein